MITEEMAVFIGGKLFNGRGKEGDYRIDVPLWDDEEGFSTLCFSRIKNDDPDWNNYMKWLSSPEGLTAVENVMIERGYIFIIDCGWTSQLWTTEVQKGEIYVSEEADTKPEAILTAAYKALQEEE